MKLFFNLRGILILSVALLFLSALPAKAQQTAPVRVSCAEYAATYERVWTLYKQGKTSEDIYKAVVPVKATLIEVFNKSAPINEVGRIQDQAGFEKLLDRVKVFCAQRPAEFAQLDIVGCIDTSKQILPEIIKKRNAGVKKIEFLTKHERGFQNEMKSAAAEDKSNLLVYDRVVQILTNLAYDHPEKTGTELLQMIPAMCQLRFK